MPPICRMLIINPARTCLHGEKTSLPTEKSKRLREEFDPETVKTLTPLKAHLMSPDRLPDPSPERSLSFTSMGFPKS